MNRLVAGLIVLAAANCAGAAESWYTGADGIVGGNYRQDGGSARVYLGYRLGTVQVFDMDLVNAAEAQLFQLHFRDGGTGGSGEYPRQLRVQGAALTWAPELKLTQDISLNSRLGVSYTHANVRPMDSTSAVTFTRMGPTGSVGAAYALTKNVRLRADVNYLQIKAGFGDAIESKTVSSGVQLQF